MALTIDSCQICKNRSELMRYAPDGRMICGDCRVTMDAGAVKKLGVEEAVTKGYLDQGSGVGYRTTPSVEFDQDSQEREVYLDVIKGKADAKWVEKFIREVVSKKILKFDWQRVLMNKRWFSVLDLRRFALELDPNFENEPEEEDLEPLRVPEEEAPGEDQKGEETNA